MEAAKEIAMYPVSVRVAENQVSGFIKLYRSLRDHWIWEDAEKLKWWLDILMECNHQEKTMNLGFGLIQCKRGQSTNSILTWSKRWRVDKSTVRRFFTLLKKDGMIKTQSLKKTTLLTVCKYDSYNENQPSKQLISNSLTTHKQPKQERKELKEDIDGGASAPQKPKNFKQWTKQDFIDDMEKYKKDYPSDLLNNFYKHYVEPTPNGRMRLQLERTWDTNLRLQKWETNENKWSKK